MSNFAAVSPERDGKVFYETAEASLAQLARARDL